MSTKLFFTLRGVLVAIRDQKVNFNDLNVGLYCLDCTREHALRPWQPYGKFDSKQTNEYARTFLNGDSAGTVHETVMSALRRAESDGRVQYLENDTDWHEAARLNDFLERHGLGRPLSDDEVPDAVELEYLLNLAGHDVTVVW